MASKYAVGYGHADVEFIGNSLGRKILINTARYNLFAERGVNDSILTDAGAGMKRCVAPSAYAQGVLISVTSHCFFGNPNGSRDRSRRMARSEGLV